MKRFPWTGFDVLVVLCLLCFMLGGCTWAEDMMARQGSQDRRIPLDDDEWVRVNSRNTDKYRCLHGQPLVCDVVVSRATCRCDGRIIL